MVVHIYDFLLFNKLISFYRENISIFTISNLYNPHQSKHLSRWKHLHQNLLTTYFMPYELFLTDYGQYAVSFDPRRALHYTVGLRMVWKRGRGSGYHTNSNARWAEDNNGEGRQNANDFGWICWCLNSSSSTFCNFGDQACGRCRCSCLSGFE